MVFRYSENKKFSRGGSSKGGKNYQVMGIYISLPLARRGWGAGGVPPIKKDTINSFLFAVFARRLAGCIRTLRLSFPETIRGSAVFSLLLLALVFRCLLFF